MSSGGEPEIVWLMELQMKILHSDAINLFGGLHGIRDEGLLQSAVAPPQNLHGYGEDVTVFDLAASYSFGLTKNHAFIDGNKHKGLLAIRAFLFRNGFRFDPGEDEAVTIMEGVAAGKVTEDLLSDWIKANSAPR